MSATGGLSSKNEHGEECHVVERSTPDFNMSSLCHSELPGGHIFGRSRWISGEFAKNFIISPRIDEFFNTFDKRKLSNFKYLRLCDFRIWNITNLIRTLNSFRQLEELSIIRFPNHDTSHTIYMKLYLPMLKSIHLDTAGGIKELILDTPRLQYLKLLTNRLLRLEIAHPESVEKLIVDRLEFKKVEILKNLKYLYVGPFSGCFDWAVNVPPSLRQLKEIHLNCGDMVPWFFEQRDEYGPADLKIYLGGLLLNGQDDPAITSYFSSFSGRFKGETLSYLAANPSRLADEIPFCRELRYSAIERVTAGSEINLLKKFTDLEKIIVGKPVQDIERFANILKNFDNIADLVLECDQPQGLLDRLPEHSALQKLTIAKAVPDLEFLFSLKNLIQIDLGYQIDAELVRKVFEELKFLSRLEFKYNNIKVKMQISYLNHVRVLLDFYKSVWNEFPDLNAAFEHVIERTKRRL